MKNVNSIYYYLYFVIIYLRPSRATDAHHALCQAPGRGIEHTVSNAASCAVLCEMAGLRCASYLFKPLSDYESQDKTYNGNCILRSKYESNFMAETAQDKTYGLYHCLQSKGKDKWFRLIPFHAYNSTAQKAIDKGFIKNIFLESSRQIKHIKVYNEQLPFWKLERKCAAIDGSPVLEYDDEISEKIQEVLGISGEPRHIGLRRLPKSGTMRAVWADGRYEWMSSAAGECPRFEAPINWSGTQIFSISGSNKYVSSTIDSSNLPTKSACEYFGENVALKPSAQILCLWTYGTHKKERAANGVWSGLARELYNSYWHGGGNAGRRPMGGSSWYAIDLKEQYLVRMMRWQAKAGSVGYWNYDMKLLVGDKTLIEGEIIDPNDYVICDEFPRQMNHQGGEIVGVTCNCLVIGRYAIFYRAELLGEVAVYGIPYASVMSP